MTIRHYEIALVLHPDLEIDLETPLKKVEQIITDNAGTIDNKDSWGKRKLAYRINGQDWGIFVFYRVQLPAKAVGPIENSLNITEEVMRHLIVSMENQKQVTSKKTDKRPTKAAAVEKPAAVESDKTDTKKVEKAKAKPAKADTKTEDK